MGCILALLVGSTVAVVLAQGAGTANTTARSNATEEMREYELVEAAETCPGQINISGLGAVEVVATMLNTPGDRAAAVAVAEGQVVPTVHSRAYFAEACTPGEYKHTDYLALKLLGRRLTYTTDLSGAKCGCNVAVYMTSLKQNDKISKCEDYYCDANSVCGEKCAEIDLQEANEHSWHSTLHTADDRSGVGAGYGGGGEGWDGPRDWSKEQYGLGGSCIDTSAPFQVAISFPVDLATGVLEAMEVTLSQLGQPCNLSISIGGYDGNRSTAKKGSLHGMHELTKALEEGMTPIVSLWESEEMLWMDGEGKSGTGPCRKDEKVACPERVPLYDFAVEDLPPRGEEPKGSGLLLILGGVIVVLLVVGVVVCLVLRGRGGARPSGDEITALNQQA